MTEAIGYLRALLTGAPLAIFALTGLFIQAFLYGIILEKAKGQRIGFGKGILVSLAQLALLLLLFGVTGVFFSFLN